jgi:hypothetical protein
MRARILRFRAMMHMLQEVGMVHMYSNGIRSGIRTLLELA